MTKKKFEEYIFGFADAETEFKMNKQIFEEAFYDPKDIIDKLINGYQFMLIGRKGVGKTAFSAKIRSLSEKDQYLNSNLVTLSNFEFKNFNKLKNIELDGTQKFKCSWDITLLIYIYRILNKNFDFSCVEEFQNRIDFLSKSNLLLGKNINTIVRTLTKKSFHFDAKFIKYDLENEVVSGKLDHSEVIEYLLEGLEDIYFDKSKQLIIIDGLDDVLRFKKERLLIIAGLVRAINELNLSFREYEVPIKIILLARDDILASITDPDFNKIRRDGGITLNWNAKNEDLKDLVNLRFILSGIPKEIANNWWYEIFPKKIRQKDSWLYISEYTLNKPRDILQFLKQCQETFSNKTSLSFSEVDEVLTDYSNEYFIEEMKNELSGFFDDDTVIFLPQIMQKIGGSDFTFIEFKRVAAKFLKQDDNGYYKKLILTLFENGYLGQVTEMKYYDKKTKKEFIKKQAIFKHKKPTIRINYDYKFSLHKGFYKALNIIKN